MRFYIHSVASSSSRSFWKLKEKMQEGYAPAPSIQGRFKNNNHLMMMVVVIWIRSNNTNVSAFKCF